MAITAALIRLTMNESTHIITNAKLCAQKKCARNGLLIQILKKDLWFSSLFAEPVAFFFFGGGSHIHTHKASSSL